VDGWVKAGDLVVGDKVLLSDGVWMTIGRVNRTPAGARVHNFEVAQNHNYYVSDLAILTHNTCEPGDGISNRTSGKPEYLRKIEAGNNFNRARTFDYPVRELYLEKASGNGYWILDAYRPGREVISRKFTQFAAITEATGVGYIKELVKKYPVNARIANVRSTPPRLRGQRLQGQLILEVPVQSGQIPQSVLDEARGSGVLIRDVFGRTY
jgi:hypothetical protein